MIVFVLKMSAAACRRLARHPTTPRHLRLAFRINALGFVALIASERLETVAAVASWLSLS